MTECPKCGQDILVEDGTISDHLDPDTLQPCSAKAKAKPAAKKTPAKAAAKKATPKKK